jgi:hypothetical protein
MTERLIRNITRNVVFYKPYVSGLFKNAQVQGAQKAASRGVYENTLSGAACSVTKQVSVFQQP